MSHELTETEKQQAVEEFRGWVAGNIDQKIESFRNLIRIKKFDDFKTITSLKLKDAEFRELKGLRLFSNLEDLYIPSSALEDLSALCFLPSLQILNLTKCRLITNIDPLENCKKITNLDIDGCTSLQDVSVLAKLPALNYLGIDSITYLNNAKLINNECKNLTELALRGDTDIAKLAESLAELPHLRTIHLRLRNLETAEALGNLIRLNHMELRYSRRLRRVDGLERLADLTRLDLRGCENLQNIDGLKGAVNLTQLDLSNCARLQSIDGLKEAGNLTQLDLSGCVSLQSIDGLKGAANLTQLDLRGCARLQNIDGLKNATDLKELKLSDCRSLKNVDGLDGSFKLVQLKMENCQLLSSIHGLRNLISITKLSLKSCESLKDITPLINLTNLKELNLVGNKSLNDIFSLQSCTNLQSLNIDDCPNIKKSNIENLGALSNLKELRYSSNPALALKVLLKTALGRNDRVWFISEFEELLNTARAINDDDFESFADVLLDGYNRFHGSLQFESSEQKLTEAIFHRENLSEETLMKYFGCFIPLLGYPKVTEFLPALFAKFSKHKESCLKPLLYHLGDIEGTEARQWAQDYAEELLQPYSSNPGEERKIAPAVCLFFTKMGIDKKVNFWLAKATMKEEPLWKDRVLVALSSYFTGKNKFREAKNYIRQITIHSEKDKALEDYILRNPPKAELNEIFDEITNEVKKREVGAFLLKDANFTARAGNVYSLLITLEEGQLDKVLTTLIANHPDSEAVKIIAEQFRQGSEPTLFNLAENFLRQEIIKENVKPKDLEKFIKELGSDQAPLERNLYEYLIAAMVNKNLINGEEAVAIRQSL